MSTYRLVMFNQFYQTTFTMTSDDVSKINAEYAAQLRTARSRKLTVKERPDRQQFLMFRDDKIVGGCRIERIH